MLEKLQLDGEWAFLADEAERFAGFAPAAEDFADTIQLPGTTAQNHKGTPNPNREDGCLTELYPFAGNAWFRRVVNIPESCRGQHTELFLERTRLTSLWVNGSFAGTQNSLCTPHRYDISRFLADGKAELILCVNNTHYPTKGGHMTSPDTQTNWNGITGRMELQFSAPDRIVSVKAVPELPGDLRLFLRTEGHVESCIAEGEWLGEQGRMALIPARTLHIRNGTALLSLGENAPVWDEYTPVIARIRLRLQNGECFTFETGLTDFRAEGMHFLSKGRQVMLRGKHDGMSFPLTGAAPTDLESWLHIFRTAKTYGINHYRFHTCCPPEAAFAAADRTGVWLQPEIPFWGTMQAPGEEGYDPQEQAYLIAEGRRILETFGNHPSFCLFSLGNELWGNPERLADILKAYHTQEQRILFTQGSNNFQFCPVFLPEDDYFTGARLNRQRLLRGSCASCDQPFGHVQTERPATLHSYDPLICPENQPHPEKPILAHEIRQYCMYPDFTEIPQYTGVLQARNYEIFRERLQAAGMGEQAEDFFRCSGQLAVQCYKAEIEAAMRSALISGFHLLDLQDFQGQGTAVVGILNAFLKNKGLVTPEVWRGFCSDAVLLGEFEDYCVTDALRMTIQLRYHRPQPLQDKLRYTVEREGICLYSGEMAVKIHGQGLFTLGSFSVQLPPVEEIQPVTVKLHLPQTENTYTLYQIPDTTMPAGQAEGVCVTTHLKEAEAALQSGGTVLFLPEKLKQSIPGAYCTDFWCYPMFRSISESMGSELPVGTLGLCIAAEHPALRGFGSETYTTPQWYELITHADFAVLDGLPVQPIVQGIDNFARNHKLGLLFSCQVGSGKLLICTARLAECSRPESAWFLRGLLRYAASEEFQPEATLTPDALKSLC